MGLSLRGNGSGSPLEGLPHGVTHSLYPFRIFSARLPRMTRFLGSLLFLILIDTTAFAGGLSYLCGDKAIRLNLDNQTVSISSFGAPQQLRTVTIPMQKVENGFEWTDKPPTKARLNLLKMVLRHGYGRNGWVDTGKAQKCVSPSILKK